jgi:hypothetical protein
LSVSVQRSAVIRPASTSVWNFRMTISPPPGREYWTRTPVCRSISFMSGSSVRDTPLE